MPPLGADRKPQAYFLGALGYRNVHDVHDADAAHQQRNAGNAGQQHREQVGGGAEHVADFFLRTDFEIIVHVFLQRMVAAQDGGYLFDGGLAFLFLDRAGEQPAQVSDRKDSLLHRSIGSQHQIVLVLPHAVVAFFLEDADDLERRGIEADGLSQHFFALLEKVVDNSLPHHAHFCQGTDVFISEHLALGHFQPAYLHIVVADPVERGGRVFGTVDELPAAAGHGRDMAQ